MATRRPRSTPTPAQPDFVVSARTMFITLLTAAILGTGGWTVSTLASLDKSNAKTETTMAAIQKQLEIFATKEALARVEQKVDAHIEQGEKRYQELKPARK